MSGHALKASSPLNKAIPIMSARPATPQGHLAELRTILQSELTPGQFERMVASLLSEFLDIGIAVARTGFQHGGDAGTSGRQNRRLRIECKRYGDNTPLSERELLGEVLEALATDAALESWILAATREASEQLELKLAGLADELGVPIIVIDWKADGFPALAALCSAAPEVVRRYAGDTAAVLATTLQRDAAVTLSRLKRELSQWGAGYERLRHLAIEKLRALWNSPSVSIAALGQNAAGGASLTTIRRHASHSALGQWWRNPNATNAPGVVLGLEGNGKTWAVLDWLVSESEALPMVLVIPSNAMSGFNEISETAIKRLLAERMFEVTQTRDREHWHRRIDRLLELPTEHEPALLVFFDGINQEPAVKWAALLALLQTPTFAGRVRVVLTTRQHHYEQTLNRLRALVSAPQRIEVGVYDGVTGGELDQRLAAEGLNRDALHEDLVPLAQTPRLFSLVVRFGERLIDVGQVTVHRLLWEYGRDSFGHRAGRSFNEMEWRQWLQTVAEQQRTAPRLYTLNDLACSTGRADLSPSEVAQRMSDILDSRFVESSLTAVKLTGPLVQHALGMALLHHLDECGEIGQEGILHEAYTWLDPIAGLDQRSEILRAAVSIMVERDQPTAVKVSTALVSEWLSSQNLPSQHASELRRIAGPLVDSLLGTIERPGEAGQRTARLWAVEALRSTSRSDMTLRAAILGRVQSWLSQVSRDVESEQRRHVQSDDARAKRVMDRVGVDIDGPLKVLGLSITLVSQAAIHHLSMIPLLLEGYPLTDARPLFELAALNLAIRGRSEIWDELKWLCLLNGVDFLSTANELKTAADRICYWRYEPGINPQLGARCSALLLWLSGVEQHERLATQRNPSLDKADYEQDYLRDPGRSFYPLLRQHSTQVLLDHSLPMRTRVDRAQLFWTDPAFTVPAAFEDEAADSLAAIEVLELDNQRAPTPTDHFFERSLAAMTRVAPHALVAKQREKLASLPARPADQLYLALAAFQRERLLFTENSAYAAAAVRRARSEARGQRPYTDNDEMAIDSLLLTMEMSGLSAYRQAEMVIDAALPVFYTDMLKAVMPLSPGEISKLLLRYRFGSEKHINDLLAVLSLQPNLRALDWTWLEHQLAVTEGNARTPLLQVAYRSNAARLGQYLGKSKWQWHHEDAVEASHWGSLAVLAASTAWPFDQVCQQTAPWLLLQALNQREATAADSHMVSELLSTVLELTAHDSAPSPCTLSVRLEDREQSPTCFSVTESLDSANLSLEQMMAANSEAQVAARQAAIDSTIERVRDARRRGAQFYLQDFDAADFLVIIDHCPAVINRWLSGTADSSTDFLRRVRLNEGFYLAFCEALFHRDANRAASLWLQLHQNMSTRFLGKAEVPDLLHLLFRVPPSPAAQALLDAVLDIKATNTDAGLLDLSICAYTNQGHAWLSSVIQADLSSPLAWRQQRGARLQGFSCGNRLPTDLNWPEGFVDQPTTRSSDNALLRHTEACARHWWEVYWSAADAESAYGAWLLFCASADRRAWTWLAVDQMGADLPPTERTLRLINYEINRSHLRSAMKKREKDFGNRFLGKKVSPHVGPWALSNHP